MMEANILGLFLMVVEKLSVFYYSCEVSCGFFINALYQDEEVPS